MSASTDQPKVRRGPKPLATREQAWDYLLLLLGRQAYTLAELRRKLERRGAEEMAEELLGRLVELRLADDATYAEHYVANRKSSRGRMALTQELRRKGVEHELVSAEVGKLDHAQQVAAAEELLNRNAWRYRPAPSNLDSEPDERAAHDERATSNQRAASNQRALSEAVYKARAKAFAFLARRGFDPDAASEALAAVGWFARDA